MQKDLWRYGISTILFIFCFHFGPIIHGYFLSNVSTEEILPLFKAYSFFGMMSLFMMVVMEFIIRTKPDKVIVVNLVGMMLKFGMFVVFYVSLDDYPSSVLHGMMIPMVYFLVLQTAFIVIKLNDVIKSQDDVMNALKTN